ncbi:hypothetical protein [Acetivibrio cellulolyticus]|uniref:hypothetical protein n=1 Tax=Acetivibrio cellulolyticus TaxID=35830 RepID=UPI0001E2D070|nr:hypothetical protein [Acetivibrio cellulolyticus]
MNELKIKDLTPKCSNYGSRHDQRILAIVNHITAGQKSGVESWFCNPASKVSAHIIWFVGMAR